MGHAARIGGQAEPHRRPTPACALLLAMALGGCASLANRPTEALMADVRARPGHVARLVVDEPAADLYARLLRNAHECTGRPTVIPGTTLFSGPTQFVVVPEQVIVSSIATGPRPDAQPGWWIARRRDGTTHVIALAADIVPLADGRTEVRAFRARDDAPIAFEKMVRNGNLFCNTDAIAR
jgi:hypothetical protein